MTYIVASLVERSVSGVSGSSLRAFRQGADLVEVRLDHLALPRIDEGSLSRVREAVAGPAIATLRSTREGGRARLRGPARERALKAVLGAGFEYVDLETDLDRRAMALAARRARGPLVIASHHFARPQPEKEVERALAKACAAGDFGKVAMPCGHAGHAIMLASLGLRRSSAGDKFTLIGMGDQGQLTRACARQMGSSMVYCSAGDRPAAPGQLDLASQAALGREDRFVLGLVGHPVAHSVSKPMQEAALRSAGLTGIYLNLDVPPEALTREALETLGKLGFSGLNVTVPHKERVRALCDELDPEAQSTGAVNTVVFRAWKMNGKNTDVIGFTKAIELKMKVTKDTSALLVGAGGAARAAAIGLRRAGAHVTVAARDRAKGERLAGEFILDAVTLDSLRRSDRRFDIIVNCTPVGTKGVGGVAPVPARLFGKGVLYLDMVYNPPVTKAMRAAASRKARAENGLEMLVQQGAASFTWWTRASPDVDAMRAAARGALG